MRDSYDTTLILWPATPLAASVAHQLRDVGVDLSELKVKDGWFTAHRTADDTVVLDLSFGDCPYGLTDLEAVLATARLAGLSYVAWDAKKTEIAGTARSYDPGSGVEREFTVMGDGEPVLTSSDLDAFEHFGTAEALLCEVRAWLRLPLPQNLSQVDGFTIVIEPEDVRARIAQALEDAEWPSVAEDVRDGVDLDTVICRIGEVMDPEEAREPIEIIERQTVAVKGGDES
jgi:hypothetical protein